MSSANIQTTNGNMSTTSTTPNAGAAPNPASAKMRKQHHLTIRMPLPRHLPPQEVIDALQTHIPVIKHQALVTRYEPAPVPLDSIVNDRFFLVDGKRIATFHIFEKISLIPGIASKEISFPVTFQSVRDGVRCRADAPGGVRLWCEYTVQTRQETDWTLATAGDWEQAVDAQREYELVETVTVETNTLLMPFVSKSMEGAHRDICKKVLEEVALKFRW